MTTLILIALITLALTALFSFVGCALRTLLLEKAGYASPLLPASGVRIAPIAGKKSPPSALTVPSD